MTKLFKIDKVLQYINTKDRVLGNHIVPNITICPVSLSNIEDARWFNNENQMNCFYDFLKKGYKGYYAYYDGLCVARLWMFTDSKRTFLNDCVLYRLRNSEIYTAWGETASDYRGKKIFTILSDFALNDNAECDVLVTINPKNNASIAAHERVGYSLYAKYIIIRVWKLKMTFVKKYDKTHYRRIIIGDYV